MVTSALLAGVLGVSLVGCEPGTSNAMKVDDHDVSRSTIDGELAVLRDHPTMARSIAGLDATTSLAHEGTVPRPVSVAWVDFRVLHLVLLAALQHGGGHIRPADRQEARRLLTSLFGASLRSAPPSFVDAFVESLAARYALARLEGVDPESSEFLQLVSQTLRHTPVELDPRYGSWSTSGRVTAPASPE
jgi:hypothetical protein